MDEKGDEVRDRSGFIFEQQRFGKHVNEVMLMEAYDEDPWSKRGDSSVCVFAKEYKESRNIHSLLENAVN